MSHDRAPGPDGDDPVVARLVDALGDAVSTAPAVLAAHRHDTWVVSLLADLHHRPAPRPRAVVTPTDTAGVATAVRICRETGTPVVPRGGGSGVVGGVLAPAGSVVVSTAALTGLRRFEPVDQLVTFGAGTNGLEAERTVQAEGLTIGHWPQSIALSTVGGWVATRAAGQLSTAYGSIEDVVAGLEVVLPDGSVLDTRITPRAAAGPDLRSLILGSEGTLGVVTGVTFALRRLPAARAGRFVTFPGFDEGLDAVREFVQAGWTPPVVRLYDARETARHFGDDAERGRCGLVLVHEGDADALAVEVAAVEGVCAAAGGVRGPDGVAETWFDHRSDAPSALPYLEQGVIVDTIEVAAPWSRVGPLYRLIVERVSEIDGVLAVSAHSSHSYRTGTNLYVSFGARGEGPDDLVAVYDRVWEATMAATVALGAGISHHHGIGRVRRRWMVDELGATGVEVLRAVEAALDPGNLFNPGVLVPGPGS